MNIWIFNHYAVPADAPGITRHHDLAKALVARGHKVSIFAAGFNHQRRAEERLKGWHLYRQQNVDGTDFVWIRTVPYRRENDWRRVLNMLSYALLVIAAGASYKKKPDLVLASSPHPLAGLSGYAVSVIRRSKFVFEVRDLWPETFVTIGGYSKNSLAVRSLAAVEKFLYSKAKVILVVMPKGADYLAKLDVALEKVVYLPNGVDPELYSGAEHDLPGELHQFIRSLKSEGTTLVGYTGSHGKADALDTVLKAARILQDEDVRHTHFLLVGNGVDKSALMLTAANLRLDNVSFQEPVARNCIPALLRRMDIVLVTKRKSRLYEYGMSFAKVFDYMMSAKPIVWAVDSPNNPVAESACGIAVPPEDPESLARTIVKMCNLTQVERQEMGMKGYKYVMRHHSIPVLADRLLKVMEDVQRDSVEESHLGRRNRK